MTMFSDLEEKIKTLSETAWLDRQLDWSEVEDWIKQFNLGDEELTIQLLFLLSNFMYFGRRETKEMLRSLYRDIYKHPIITKIRKDNDDTKDRDLINQIFSGELEGTRFLGIGNPSESGTHLLYFFRQENKLPKRLFIHGHEIFKRDLKSNDFSLRDKSINRYVFIDDLTCSGSQAVNYSQNLVNDIKKCNPKVQVFYYVLFTTEDAITNIKRHTDFDDVKGIFELDSSFKCFSDESRYYRNVSSNINRSKSKDLCELFDKPLSKSLCEGENIKEEDSYILGFNKSELLLSFYHNTPDNVPPIFWFEGVFNVNKRWLPIFQRYHKVY